MLTFTQSGPVATLHIQRAAKKNAFNTAMWRDLHAACERLAQQVAAGAAGAPRALLLRGERGVFCAGADIEEMAQMLQDPDASASRMAASQSVIAQAQLALEALPIPTLAVIDGPCFGGGFGLAAACDFRLGSAQARFAVTPARLGLLYSLADTHRLVRLVGDARARRLLVEGTVLDADLALQWGVLAQVLPDSAALDAAATAMADGLAERSRTAMAGLKATLACVAGIQGAPSTAAVRQRFDAAFHGPDFAEGTAAFLAKRAPRFD